MMRPRISVIPTYLLLAMSASVCAYTLPVSAETGLETAGASRAVDFGEYRVAEQALSKYVYRSKEGDLKLYYFGLSGKTRKQVIDTVVRLLWETGRDDTLKQFADDYLSGDEYRITLCRISERQAHFEDAYQCWNKLGDVDRAERVLRTEAALRILGTP